MSILFFEFFLFIGPYFNSSLYTDFPKYFEQGGQLHTTAGAVPLDPLLGTYEWG